MSAGYEEAVQRIRAALDADGEVVALHLRGLERLPPEIAEVTWLTVNGTELTELPE